MAIAQSLKNYLEQQSVGYKTVSHTKSHSSLNSAAAAHVPRDWIAKAVILKEDESYLMVVVPTDHHVHLGRMHRHLGHEVGLATEAELTTLFPDCDAGAIPPVGAAYGLRTLIDDSLTTQSDIFFESGDHLHMVKVSGDQFVPLLGEAEKVSVGKQL